MKRSMERIEFAKSILFTSARFANTDQSGINIVPIDDLRSKHDYSTFMVNGLIHHVQTDHVLVVQWDGFVIHESAWTGEFLQFDYIGAPWHPRQSFLPTGHSLVGNGGFSLRSRKLLKALQDKFIQEAFSENSPAEDVGICVTCRPYLESVRGMRFAPLAVAERFAYEESEPVAVPTFGFHSLKNFGRVFDSGELTKILAELPDDLALYREALFLAESLLDEGRRDEAIVILKKRLALRRGDPGTLKLASEIIRRNADCWCGSARKFAKCCGSLK